jgi:heme/copper-type cytochrome/quinol oxidase subunit 1
MPRQSVWFVRASLLYLALGFTFGGLMLANKGLPVMPWAWSLLPAHMEFLLLGWLVQLAMGVAYWILPRFSSATPRGDERLIWIALILFNLGIWLVAIVIFIGPGWLTVTGRAAEALGVASFTLGVWRRIKPSGA